MDSSGRVQPRSRAGRSICGRQRGSFINAVTAPALNAAHRRDGDDAGGHRRRRPQYSGSHTVLSLQMGLKRGHKAPPEVTAGTLINGEEQTNVSIKQLTS